jgi:lysophospholipase L1-like esterase
MPLIEGDFVMRIVFLGDSLTWGRYGGDFVAQVAAQMPDHTILNAGVGGDTVINLLRRVDEVIETFKPDAIFVMVGGNDAVSYINPVVRPYYKSAKKIEVGQVTPEQFRSTYRDLLLHIQTNYIQVAVGLAPTEFNVELVEARHQYNAIAREVAEDANIPILDLDALFTPAQPIIRPPADIAFIQQIGARSSSGWNDYETERAKWGYTFTFDGMHLLPETAKRFADVIVPFIREHFV